MSIDNIVEVFITREATPVKRENFGIELILGVNKVFAERAKSYSSLSEMVNDGFLTTDKEYLAAEKTFSQVPRPEQIVVGRRASDKTLIKITNVVADIDYKTTINDVNYIYDSGVAPTAITIAAGLVLAINGGTEPVTATDNLDGTYDLDADVPGVAYTVAVDTDQTVTSHTLNDTITDDIIAIQNFNNEWYIISEMSQNSVDVLELAAWVETQPKLFGTTSDDNNIVDQSISGDTTSIAALLRSADYDRTYVAYWNADYLKVVDDSTNKYLDAAWNGVQLTKDPGKSTWAHKNIKAFQPITLNSTQVRNGTSKFANLYIVAGADGRTRFGTVASGEYIDIMRGIDWLTARLQEDVFILLATTEKVPFTSAGIAMVEGVIKSVLNEAVNVGLLEAGYVVEVPKIQDVDPIDRANRLLTGITFKAIPAGAIHIIQINGEVSVFEPIASP